MSRMTDMYLWARDVREPALSGISEFSPSWGERKFLLRQAPKEIDKAAGYQLSYLPTEWLGVFMVAAFFRPP